MIHQKKPAGLRKEGAALLLTAALLFGLTLTGCGEDPATADEIAAAVVAREQAEKDKGNDTETSAAYATTLQSAFKRMLSGGSYGNDGKQSVTPVKALDGTWTQADAAYTVSSTGTDASLSTTFLVYKDEKGNGQKSYTVRWKVKTAPKTAEGTLDTYNGASLTGAKAGTEVTAELSFQIANPDNRSELISGTVTLKHTPNAEVILNSLEATFENSLFQTGVNSYLMPISDWWAVKPLTGTWGQTGAKYTATMKKPSSDGTLQFPNGATWAVDTPNTTAKGFTIATSPTLTANTDSGAGEVVDKGKLTLKFTLTDSKVAGEKVEGTVEITVVD